MKIKLEEITIHELNNGQENNQENGVVGLSGKLDIRPPYQSFSRKEREGDHIYDNTHCPIKKTLQ